MDDDTLRAGLRLCYLRGVNNEAKTRLLRHFGNALAIFAAPSDTLAEIALAPASKLKKAINLSFETEAQDRIEQQLALLHQHHIQMLTYSSQDYPEQLKQIDDAPPVLYLRGDVSLLNGPQIAMVGSRNTSPSGIKTAKAFAAEFAKTGLSITSGLALGIDTAAHQGALDEIGKTLAVVATGLDQVFPQRNLSLAKAIVNKGLMISEFPPLTPPRREHFPRRNRLISGLSMGVLVVEADTRSGSLITARLAGEQGREVFAIPGSIHSPTSRGCHQLIRQGAKLVETTADVLLELEPKIKFSLKQSQNSTKHAATDEPKTGESQMPALDKDAITILKLIDFSPTSLEEITMHSNLSVELVSSALLQLELDGHIAPLAGAQYQRLQN